MTPSNGKNLNEPQNPQIAGYLSQLDALIRRGHELRERLLADPASVSSLAAARLWHEQCGVTINQLSGGSKAHWLARAFSEAFLMRSASGQAMETVAAENIVDRLLNVLTQAVTSLSQTDSPPVVSPTATEVTPRRFDFVHNAALRPVLEQAYTDGRHALDEGGFDLALRTSCGILEAIVTDALEHKGMSRLISLGAPPGAIADWSFLTRLTVAEKAGLIRGGYVRLPEAAWKYREDEAASAPATESAARRAVQVLNVIMRDLNPGR